MPPPSVLSNPGVRRSPSYFYSPLPHSLLPTSVTVRSYYAFDIPLVGCCAPSTARTRNKTYTIPRGHPFIRPPVLWQIVDSGLNETSCYFAHGDGTQVDHGHYFEAVGSTNPSFSSSSESSSRFKSVFEGGDFTYDSDRRKVRHHDDTNGGGFPFCRLLTPRSHIVPSHLVFSRCSACNPTFPA